MDKSLVYVTGNKHKFQAAEYFLGKRDITLQQEKVNIDEIQSESIEEVAIDKAKKSFEVIKKALIVNDAGWMIPALNGFPGPFMKFINNWFRAEDLINLMENKTDRTIILKDIYVFYDGTNPKVFSYEFKGKILGEPKGEGRPSDMVVTLHDDGESIAQKMADGNQHEEYNKFWNDFSDWFLNN